MGGFFKSIAKMGAMGAATAAGGPLAGAAAAGGMGALSSLAKGGSLGDMLIGAGTGAGGAYLGGELAPVDQAMPYSIPEVPISMQAAPVLPDLSPNLQLPSILDELRFKYNK